MKNKMKERSLIKKGRRKAFKKAGKSIETKIKW
jgi:hypothetical protein